MHDWLLSDPIGALSGLVLGRLDCQAHLLRDMSADEAADTMVLPIGRFGNLGDRRAGFPTEEFKHDRFLGIGTALRSGVGCDVCPTLRG